MKLFITGISALDFYRKTYPAYRAPGLSSYGSITKHTIDFAHRDDDIWSLAPSWVTPDFLAPENGRLHVLVNSAAKRTTSKTVASHVWSNHLPAGSCFDCNGDVLVASPGFIFLQLANTLDLLQLIALGDELCGFYSFDEASERGVRKRVVPLTNKEELRCYLESAAGIRGQKAALSALDYVVEQSASPMETLDEMLLCLPPRYGGYGLPLPSMNHPIPLSEKAQALIGVPRCHGDICWPDVPLDVEHNGGFDHSSPHAQSNDRARVNAIAESGYEVIELTDGQISNLAAFEVIALRIAAKVGKRIRPQQLGATKQRLHLRKTIYAWNRAYGRCQ